MDVVNNTYLPGDPRLIQQLVYELKSQGIFDQFRKECIADVDTKPAYQNLRQRVEGSVTSFLKQQTWKSDMNKNQVREQLKKNIYESGYLETGVERIVDQVVNPKINTIFLPQVEEVVYRYLGVEKPSRTEVKKELKIDVTDLLPTDLEAVSPESDHPTDHNDKKDDSNIDISSSKIYKLEEDESPPFEPLEVEQTLLQQEENSVDSHLSGFSGLHSHDSNPSNNDPKIMELSNPDSQVSRNSSESHLSIITSEENTKMDICEYSDSKLVKSTDSESKIDISVVTPINYEQDDVQKEVDEKSDKMEQNKKDDKKTDLKKYEDMKKFEKHNEDKKLEEKRNDNKKYEKKDNDKKSRNLEKHGLRDKKDDKYRKSSSNNSKDKDKSVLKHTSTSLMKDKEKTDKSKNKKDVKSSSSGKGKDKCEKEKEKHEKSDKEKPDKDREKNDKDKSKSSSSNSSRHSSSCTKNKEKSSDVKKESTSKEKEKSHSSSSNASKDGKSKSAHSDSKHKSSGDKHKKSDRLLHNDKSASSSSSTKKDKDKKREAKKDLKDDHYSAKEKKNHRRSTDRDSNDGQPTRQTESSSLVVSGSYPQKSNEDTSSLNNSSGSGDSGNSDKSEHSSIKSPTKLSKSIENVEMTVCCNDVQKFKYIKPKFASNFREARKLMKIRKQLAKLEKQNQLSLVHIEVPVEQLPIENGIACEQIQIIDDLDKTDFENPKITETNDYSNVDSFMNELKNPETKIIVNVMEQTTPEKKKASNSKVDSNDSYDKEQNTSDINEISNYEVDGLINKSTTPERTETVHLNVDIDNKEEKTPEGKEIILPNVITPLLQSTNLSKESWEALEARLAQEMSNVNYNSYESPYDDYDCATYNSIIISPRKKNSVEKYKITEEQLVETGREETPVPNYAICKMVNNVKIEESIEDADKNVNYGNVKGDFNEHQLTIEIKDFVNKETLVEKENTPHIIECTPKCVEGKELEQTINMVKNDKRITKNLQIILKNEEIKNTPDIDDQCRYLEKPSPGFNRHLDVIYEYVGRLEQAIGTLRKTAQNNFLPTKKGRKRKLEENVDLKNNNKAHYEQSADTKKRGQAPNINSVTSKANKERMCNTEVLPNNNFLLPLSPAESDKSNDKKEESPKSAKQKRNIISKNATSRNQRYSSDDLYKPRPTFATTRRSRGAKNLES